MFPKLISGPIVTYDFMNKQLENRKNDTENIMIGFKYFIIGLGFKVLLANRISCLWNDILMIGIESISTGLACRSAYPYMLPDEELYRAVKCGRGIISLHSYDELKLLRCPYVSLITNGKLTAAGESVLTAHSIDTASTKLFETKVWISLSKFR